MVQIPPIAPRGRLGKALLLTLGLLYLWFALAPFDWNPPRWVRNEARLDSEALLSLPASGILRSIGPAPLLFEAIDREEFRLVLRAKSAMPIQKGPARIFTISLDPYFRNLTLGQEGHDLVLRLRTPVTTANGLPPYVVPGVFDVPGWHEIDVSILRSKLILSVDNRTKVSAALPKNSLKAWNPNFSAALGNELSWDRPWIGTISSAVATVGDENCDYLRTPAMAIPAGFWKGSDDRVFDAWRLVRLYDSPMDLCLNFLCFVPVGFLLAMTIPWPKPLAAAMWMVAIGCLLVEISQFCFAGHHPSVVDWILNTVGAGLGAWIASRHKLSSTVDSMTKSA